MTGRRIRPLLVVAVLAFAGLVDIAAQSRQFGDIGISVHRLANGSTYHGYCEYRFTLLNSDPGREHTVTVELPSSSRSHSSDSIQELRRSVKVSAGGTVSLPLLQPALPINGGNAARILVDGREQGILPLSGGFDHAEFMHGRTPPRPYLVSRSLDSSALDTALTKLAGGSGVSRVDYSPYQATGHPNVPSGRGGYHGNAWLPERTGRFDWLELRYGTPVQPDRIRIYKSGRDDSLVKVDLYGEKGAALGTITNSASTGRYESRYKPYEFKLSGITQAVHRVRLELDGTKGGYVGIDAVELIGKGINVFATGATASSTYATMHGRHSRSTVDKPVILRSELEVGEWSDHWQGFSAFDAVVLHRADLTAMPPVVAQAFWAYVEAGGVAAVLGEVELPREVRARPAEDVPGAKRLLVGFGECLMIQATDTRDLDAAQLRLLDEAGKRTAGVWPAFGDLNMANSTFPVIDNLSIPVRGIALIMLIFIVAVGPLNIFLLARFNRRIWMLWTIPVISLVTCGVVFVYSLFSEGITSHVRAESVTLLDHSSHRATTLGRLAYYCPLTPSGGLRFDYDTELYPIVSRGWGQGTAKTVDWTDGQHLKNGWLQARMPAHFVTRKSEIRRERLQFEKDAAGNWVVLNGLGTTIKQLVLRTDPDQEPGSRPREWRTGTIAPGAKATLTLAGSHPANGDRHEALRRLFKDGRWSAESAGAFLRGGNYVDSAYVAEIEGTPFLDDGLNGRKELKSAGVVIGLLSPEEAAL